MRPAIANALRCAPQSTQVIANPARPSLLLPHIHVEPGAQRGECRELELPDIGGALIARPQKLDDLVALVDELLRATLDGLVREEQTIQRLLGRHVHNLLLNKVEVVPLPRLRSSLVPLLQLGHMPLIRHDVGQLGQESWWAVVCAIVCCCGVPGTE